MGDRNMDPTDETIGADSVTRGASPPAAGAPLGRGAEIGRYVVIGRLGAGGMGVVYSAFDPELDRKVAVKLLRPGVAPESSTSDGASRLLREAQAMARLSHPNVVPVFDVGRVADRVFVAMEFVKGATLTDWLEPGRSTQEILEVFTAAGRGLAAAHASDLVHRDFKPDNVMVGDDDRVRVMDFGLARPTQPASERPELEGITGSLDALSAELTAGGAIMGTPKYMAPEQWVGLPTDARTDQFSFCVALHIALYGQHPFPGDSPAALAFNVTQGQRAARPEQAIGWLDAVIDRGLQDDPERRWPDMAALLEALRPPADKRRRMLMGGLGGAIAVGVVAAAVLIPDETVDQCAAVRDDLGTVWDDARRAEMLDAFAGVDRPYAERTGEQAAQELDRYAASWLAARVDACEDSAIRAEQSDEARDLRMACLDGRLRALDAVVATLGEVDVDTVDRAPEAVAGLPGVDRCSDVAALRAAVEPPDPAVTEEVESVRTGLARVRALDAVGRYGVAVQELESLSSRAVATGYIPVQAETVLVEGELSLTASDGEAAGLAYTKAATLAIGSGHDEVAGDALRSLALVYGHELGQPRVADAYLVQAKAWAERNSDPPAERARLLEVEAAIHVGKMELDRAEELYREAIVIHEQSGEIRSVASTHQSLATTLALAGKLPAAKAEYERVLEYYQDSYGTAHPSTDSAANNLANTLTEMGDNDAARELYAASLSFRRETFGNRSPHVATALLNFARLDELEGKHDEARSKLVEAETIAASNPNARTSLPDVYNALSMNAGRRGEPEQQLEYLRQSISAIEDLHGLDHPSLATPLFNLANVDFSAQEFEKALEKYERVLEIWESTLAEDHWRLAFPLGAMGGCYVELGRPAEGVAMLERALELAPKNAVSKGAVPEFRYLLGKALWSDEARRSEGLALVEQALGQMREAGKQDNVEEVEQWLAGKK